jgi:exodeoxyribonuclease-3
VRIITLNANGIRSATAKGFLGWMKRQKADLVCVQEIKAQESDLPREILAPARHHAFFHPAERKGYSGVAVYARREPDRVVLGLGIPDVDAQGRYLQLDYGNLSVVSLYVPSGSSGEEAQARKLSFMKRFLPRLEEMRASGREFILCGDWNIAHKEVDLKNWRSNQKNSGFLPEERAWLTDIFDRVGWVDVYRRLQPEATAESYTWWSNRGRAWENNVGWRLDYHVATPGIAAVARRAAIYKDRRFSDHAPLTIDYDVKL